jgi:TonB family protein
MLIAAGAKPGAAGDSGLTPLMAAALHDRAAYAQVLLRAGADANARLPDGSAALHIAGESRADAVTEVLLAHGANPHLPNKRGLTPLQTALYARARGPADAMVARGAALSLKGADTADLLEIAIAIDAAGVVKQALADGWSPDTEFRGGWPALLVANECKAQACAAVLRAAGAKEAVRPEAPAIVKAKELDARLAIATAVNAHDPRDFTDDFPSSTVEVDVVVDRNGEVRFPRVVGSPTSSLAVAALDAVAQWKFALPQRNKTPVATKARIPIVFASSRDLFREQFEVDSLPVPVKRVSPFYPMNLRRAGISGDVVVRFVVNAAGHTEHLRVVTSQHPDLDAAAVEAMQKWVYQPALLEGKPVGTWVEQMVSFRVQ